MKRFILAMAMGVSALASPAIADSTFHAGDITGGQYDQPEKISSGTSFNSTYDFELSQSSTVYIALLNSSSLSGLGAKLYDSNNVLRTSIGLLDEDNVFADWQSTNVFTPGTYRVDVFGVNNSEARGKYTLTVSSDVAAPVPGPAGFVVAGAGALVVAARKRRKARFAAA